MAKVSILIPARNEPYLVRTVDDIFRKATGEIEVLVMLDGWRPDEPLPSDPRLKVVYRLQSKGTRNSVNQLARLATGKYIIRMDAHCLFDEGFDEKLQDGMEDDWLATPSRYSLDPVKWERKGHVVEYLTLTFPYFAEKQFGTGFHGKKWCGRHGIGKDSGAGEFYWPEEHFKDKRIDDLITNQGSCSFMTLDHFRRIGGLDEVHSYHYQDPQELTFKTWLSGGRCVVNKNTWYAHLHKTESPCYGFTKTQKKETERFSTWVWMNDKWPGQTRPLRWLIEKFWPMDYWPDNWDHYIDRSENFTVFDADGHDGFFHASS